MTIRLDTPQNGYAIDWLGQRIRLPICAIDTSGQISAQLGDASPGFINPTIPGFIVAALVRIPPDFGKKRAVVTALPVEPTRKS